MLQLTALWKRYGKFIVFVNLYQCKKYRGAETRKARARNTKRKLCPKTSRRAYAWILAVAGAEYVYVGYGAHHNKLFHRLVGRSVLANADGIVRHNVNYGQFHKSAHSHARLHITRSNAQLRRKDTKHHCKGFAQYYERLRRPCPLHQDGN